MTSSTTSPTATPGPVHDLTGPSTLGEACELLGRLDLFGDAAAGARGLAPLPPLGL